MEDEPELEAVPQSDLDVVTLVFRIKGNAGNIGEIRIGGPEKTVSQAYDGGWRDLITDAGTHLIGEYPVVVIR